MSRKENNDNISRIPIAEMLPLFALLFALVSANVKEVKNPFKNGKSTPSTPSRETTPATSTHLPDGEGDPSWRPLLPAFLHGATPETIDAFYDIILDLTISIKEKNARVDKLIKTQPTDIQEAYANFEDDHKRQLEELGEPKIVDPRDRLSLSEELKLLEDEAVKAGEDPIQLPLE